MSKIRWAPTSVPLMRRSMGRALRESAAHALAIAAQPHTRADAADQLLQGAASTLDDADRLEAATLYWASGPMARAALDASQDFPAITAEDCPAATAPATWRPPKAAPLAVDRPLRPRTRGLPARGA